MHLESKGVSMSNWPSEKELETVRNRLNKSIASKLLPKDASPLDRLRYKLCEKFILYKHEHNLTQRDLALQIGINESLMSKILHYHFEEFTADRLIKYLNVIYPNLDLSVDIAS